MKRKSLFSLLMLLLAAPQAFAQMSEDKIIQYIAEQQEKGVSQEQIVMDLSRRGVTIQQLQKMREKYNKSNASGILGNTLSDGSTQNITRSRNQNQFSKNPDYYSEKTLNLIKSQDQTLQDSRANEQERLQMMYDESMFLFTDSLYLLRQSLMPKKEIFGHNLFKSDNLTFQPGNNLATPKNYTLGPGDEVIIDIWGASQTTIQETISPDGSIIVENIGPVYLNGLTVQEADKHLKRVFSQIYSGLNDGEAESHIQLSLGQNRSILVNVMGEVMYPGSYQMSSFGTVFNALYMAGGVSEIGTLRAIKVYRANRQIASIDLYDYLMNGNISSDIRLADNDVVMVAPINCLVNIDGRIRRPMFYEMSQNESLAKLLEYAGGMVSDAYRKDVRVTHMGDIQRSIFTVSSDRMDSFIMTDGDSVYVDSIMVTYSNMAEVRGAVNHPGMFQVGDGINTLSDLIEAAGGFREDAFLTRALLNRTNPDKTLINKAVDLSGYPGGFIDEQIRNNDILYIPSLFDMREEPTFSVFGEVQFPGVYAYAENTHIEDIILQAGGLTDAASIAKIDVVRRMRDNESLESSDDISTTFTFSIDKDLRIGDETFTLNPFDEVYVRRSPGYADTRRVQIEGEVMFPGYYSLSTKGERLSDIVTRSGLFTSEAYPSGARLERKMTDDEKLRLKDITKLLTKNDSLSMDVVDMANTFYVGINLAAAMEDPGGTEDIFLRDGDRLIVPEFSNTVKMNGQVMYSNTVSYQKGKNLMYYIDKAGGYSEDARKSRAYVIYMNGTVAKARKHSGKLIQPGCEIIVPAKSERERMSTSEILSLSSTSASLATVVIALLNLFK